MAFEFALTFIVAFVPPFILYVIVTGNMFGFVNVMFGKLAFSQTEVVPLILAVGVGFTTIVEEPEIVFKQDGLA